VYHLPSILDISTFYYFYDVKQPPFIENRIKYIVSISVILKKLQNILDL